MLSTFYGLCLATRMMIVQFPRVAHSLPVSVVILVSGRGEKCYCWMSILQILFGIVTGTFSLRTYYLPVTGASLQVLTDVKGGPTASTGPNPYFCWMSPVEVLENFILVHVCMHVNSSKYSYFHISCKSVFESVFVCGHFYSS